MFVKICGITSEEDALLAVAMGADAVGFVFAPSTRQVSAALTRDIVRRLPPEVLTVGVFRDDAPSRVVQVCQQTGLKAAQLHGHESVEDTHIVKGGVGLVIKGFAAGSPMLDRLVDFKADAVLIDAPRPGAGEVFDWTLAEGLPSRGRIVLAGGLTPANVADAVVRVRPWGVDVSSGVEVAPGRKDPVKVRAFVHEAKRAEVPAYQGDDEHPPYDWETESLR
jgi:phosphoribosylanthranilate isomerase